MDDLMREFLTESAENLAMLDQTIVDLEQRPSPEALASIFRTMHTIKGTCGFLGLPRLEGVAHAAEDVLGRLRENQLPVTASVITAILRAVDRIKVILAGLESTETEPEGEDGDVTRPLQAFAASEAEARATAAAGKAAPARPVAEASAAPPPAAAVAAARRDVGAAPAAAPAEAGDPVTSAVANQTLRVSVDILDQLMNMVGELVLTRNQLLQLTKADEDSHYGEPVQQLNRVTSGLQEAVMKTRMQPIGNAWAKLPRLVRDLCQASGKQIELVMHGAETELDRQILQSIQDPLVHMVRNSADHGIEPPDVRRGAGKPPSGTITLNAYHEGGHIIIEIADDGAGINVARVRQRAIERGLVSADAAAALPENRVLEFIFAPGFSTAAEITAVSGRGVGMDVVKTNIERIGGVVDVGSRAGRGTTIRVKIPLTLAIISALIVGNRDQAFAIPQIGIVELVRVAEENRQLIEEVHGSPVLRLRDHLLPLVRLDAVLGLPRSSESRDLIIVVAQVGEARFGLVVDEVFDTQEIVVKPIGRLVKDINLYAGTTILGDGRVIMILDAAAISSKAHAIAASTRESAGAPGAASGAGPATTGTDERMSLLLFRSGAEAVQAVPLSLVTRLEEIPVSKIEVAAGRYLVQYRGALLPLVPAGDGLSLAAVDPRPVIVFANGERAMGLVVDQILDIVESTVRIEAAGGRPGILGAAIVNGAATEVIDTYYYLQQAGDWVGRDGEDGAPQRLLLLEPSNFYRDLLAPKLRAAGYDVVAEATPEAALARFEGGQKFDAVLVDFDEGGARAMNLAITIREQFGIADAALLALARKVTPEDQRCALAAGFAACVPKADRDAVVAGIQSVLHFQEAGR